MSRHCAGPPDDSLHVEAVGTEEGVEAVEATLKDPPGSLPACDRI